MPVFSAFGRQRQMFRCEANLGYSVFKVSKYYSVRPVSKREISNKILEP